MFTPTFRRFICIFPVTYFRSLRSTAHRSPATSLESVITSNDTDSKLSSVIDGFNRPDPSKYCQNLGVEDTVSILREWLATLDVDQHYPALPEANNLAALVSQWVIFTYFSLPILLLPPLLHIPLSSNECLRKLVDLGADLSRMEAQPGVANLLVKTDFDTTISPKLWLLTDFGFELSQIARIMTHVPKTIVKVSSFFCILSHFIFFYLYKKVIVGCSRGNCCKIKVFYG